MKRYIKYPICGLVCLANKEGFREIQMRRVVVTGIGIVSSIGNNKEEVLNSLRNGI